MLKFLHKLCVATFLAAAFLASGQAFAIDALKQGPKVGSQMPHTLETNDQHNKAQNFDALKGKRGLILFFTRSFDW